MCIVFRTCIFFATGLISRKLAPGATFSPLSFVASVCEQINVSSSGETVSLALTTLSPSRGSINGALGVMGKGLGLEGFGMGLPWTLIHSRVGGKKM